MRPITTIFLLLGLLIASATIALAQTADTSLPDTAGTETVEAAPTQLEQTEDQIYPLSAERFEKLVAYSKFKNNWRFVEFFIGLFSMAVLLFFGLSARFRNWAKVIKVRFFSVWLFLILFLLADYILTLPFNIYRNFMVENSYGFLNQSFAEWWGEDLLGLFLGAVIGIVPMWFFYWLIGRTKKWWLAFTVGSIPLLILLVVIAPIWISPIFNEFGPLEDKQTEATILALADKAGIEGADVFEVDGSKQSTKVNAYVTGLFGTKRIVLYDTIIRAFTLDEIKFVMAHEMGHYVMNHVWWGLLVALLFLTGALWLMNRTIHPIITRFSSRFGFERLSDVASLPLVLIFFTVISFAFQPITNGFSRYIEHEADIYGMEMSGVDGEDAAIAFDKLSAYNLSDPNPHPIIEFWFYNHPALGKRMEFVRGWGK